MTTISRSYTSFEKRFGSQETNQVRASTSKSIETPKNQDTLREYNH